MDDWRSIVRLGVAPLLLLGWNMFSGLPLAYIAPILAVFLLMPGGARPPVGQMLQVLLIVVAISWVLSRSFMAVADSPIAVWVLLLALACGCFAQLAVKPQNVPALLALMVSVLVTTLIQADPAQAGPLPVFMGLAVAQAVGVTLLAHVLLPSQAPPRAPPLIVPARKAPGLRALAKAMALVCALVVCAAVEFGNSLMVAMTLVNMLRLPEDTAAHRFGRWLLFANLGAALLVLPVLLVAILRPENNAVIPLALGIGLWIAAGNGAPGWRGMLTQLGMTVFILLVGQLLPQIGTDALAAMGDRLLTIGMTVLYGTAVLIILRPARRMAGA
jgi:hypothetical protein